MHLNLVRQMIGDTPVEKMSKVFLKVVATYHKATEERAQNKANEGKVVFGGIASAASRSYTVSNPEAVNSRTTLNERVGSLFTASTETE